MNEATADRANPTPTMRSVLRHGGFRTLWLAQTVSWTGDHFTFLALMITINTITGSASAVALLMIITTIPRLLLGMAAGVFVDRWDRKRLMVAADAMRGVLSLMLIWAAVNERVWVIYPLAFATSCIGVFFVPARGAVMKTILRQDELMPANILMQLTLTLTGVFGAALAGVVIGAIGVAPAFAFDALTFFVSSSLVATMTVPRLIGTTAQQAAGGAAFWREFKEGLAFVAATPTVTGLLLVLTVVSLATGAVNALFVPFLMNVLHAGAAQLGLVDSAQGIGMIAGSVLAAGIARRLRANQIIAGGLMVASIFIGLIGLAPTYLVVLALLPFVGLVVSPINATIPALTQKVVPLDKMGRVGGTMNTSQSVATLLSMGIAGALADVIGPRIIFVAAGMIGFIASLVAVGAIRDDVPGQTMPSVAKSPVSTTE